MESFGHKGRTASFSSITEAFPLLRAQNEAARGFDQEKHEKLWSLMSSYMASDVHSIQRSIANHVEYTLASSRFNFDEFRAYLATAHSVRDRLIESWNDTNQHFEAHHVKRVAYMSLEFLMGRSLQNCLLNMDLEDSYRQALKEMGYDLEKLYDREPDAALGNGGLGRLAACFLDSMATLDLPAWGYGIRYTYGIFRQLIKNGAQVEAPDYWLTFGNPFEIERVDIKVPVRFYGEVVDRVDERTGKKFRQWRGGEKVMAVAYDNPVPGFDTYNTINLRLWRAAPSDEFDLASFNTGDYMRAVEQRQRAETITHVLYPSDNTYSGKELRLKQQYFFVSATLRDVIRRFTRSGLPWSDFPTKNAIQLNDTHPSIGIAELMRILVDEEWLDWDEAWAITTKTFAYTNHTILPEALEKWSVDMLGHLLPRHLEIIYEVNWRFLEEVKATFGDDPERIRRMSIVEEGYPKAIRMAHLAMVGSHTTNGVAAIHSELLKSAVFPDFYALFPERFQNKTNGVTPRRWINQCNPALAGIVSKWLDSDEWLKHLDMLAGLRPVADHPELHKEWRAMKMAAKARLADYIRGHVTYNHPTERVTSPDGKETGPRQVPVVVNPAALFDVQVKRIHEYKRQQLNALYVIHRYNTIKRMAPEERRRVVPRVVIFGGKAAPGYAMAKIIIKLILRISDVVNHDADVGDLLKVVFIPNYNVSLAEIICPASDLSQHISTAGMEASGTSNMKFAMNGGLIIGTLDGANIEIAAEIDRENMFIFGAEAHQVPGLRMARKMSPPPAGDDTSLAAAAARSLSLGVAGATKPAKPALPAGAAAPATEWPYYCEELQAVMQELKDGKWLPAGEAASLLGTLGWGSDYYLSSHDFPAYLRAQEEVDRVYADAWEWTRRSILSTAGSGKFSTDRTIEEYAREIWALTPCRRSEPVTDAMGRARSFPNLSNPTLGDGGPLTAKQAATTMGSGGGAGGLAGLAGSHGSLKLRS